MQKIFLILMIIQCSMCFAAEAVNVQSSQVGNSGVITYDLTGDSGEDTEVTFTVEYQGKTYTQDMLSLRGDIGKVTVGNNKKIYWDILKDFPKGLVGNVEWSLDTKAKTYKDPITGMEFVFVKGGCYQMGSNSGEPDEKPVHEVCVDDFFIGKYEVTQGQWQAVMGDNPSRFSSCGSDCPVEQVYWNDVKDFIRKLNSRSSVTFRLPTEAEWEYAAKGGENYTYSGSNNIDNVAWYKSNSVAKTHPVGQKQPNGYGVYDMSGNVWEWVEDTYNKSAYSQHQRYNPIYTGSVQARVLRGGSWKDNAQGVRSSSRDGYTLDSRCNYLGFRLIKSAK